MTPTLTQIQRRLMQLEVWRFVGFASVVLGLLCYAMSSSFNYLFGDWNFLKTFLYSVFSFIICFLIWFAKVWQRSSNHRFEAHIAFLVLAITSVYSFFLDKAVNRKPDAYSLISCAAFALVSLSLSKQIRLGFEVDLLYFFLGALIVQLMKIKLWLGIAGVGFSYSLIILRSSLAAPLENRHLGHQDQHHVAIQMEPRQSNTGDSAPVITYQHPNTSAAIISSRFMTSVEQLRRTNQNVVEVFRSRLNQYLTYKDHMSVALVNDRNFLMDELPSQAVGDLHENVKLTIKRGFEKECLDQYSSWRSQFLHECLLRFGLNELNSEEVDEKRRIKRWNKLSNIALRFLLPNERTLCDRIFSEFSSVADLSFMLVCKEVTTGLLNFANTLAIQSRSLNLLPSILQVFDALHDLIPEFESLFSDQCSVSLRTEAFRASQRLWEARSHVFMMLENLIRRDTAPPTFLGGVHPITVQVMNHLSAVGKVKSSLHFDEVIRVIELLERHLVAKSKYYTNPALGYVFLMNNGWYIVRKAKQYKLRTILGNDWFHQHTGKVRQNIEHYQRSSWDEALGLLKLDNNESVEPDVEAESMNEKLHLFHMHFKEILMDQSAWFIFIDKELREKIRESLEQILVPAYAMFFGRFQSLRGKHADTSHSIRRHIEDRLREWFDGLDDDQSVVERES